jgi:chemotaxis protein methyltransferase CheR
MSLSSKEFEMMQKFIEEQCGIAIREEKAYLIESRLTKLLIDSGLTSFEDLYKRICHQRDPIMKERVIDAITTNETLWFRDRTPWEVLENSFLPVYIKEIREGKRTGVRIWSAACSTGQEAYSTAMCIDNYLTRNGIKDVKLSHFKILATDISHTVLSMAKAAKYDSISIMRGLDNTCKNEYFTNEGRIWKLDERIKNSVTFQQFNLQNSFLLMGKLDIIFCRYVIIYFSENLKNDVIKKMASALQSQGALFLGSSEIFPQAGNAFVMEKYKTGVYYRLKE